MKVELYYYEQCPYCRLVLNKIKSLGLSKIDYKNTLEDSNNKIEHYEKTGRTTVPCIYIDDDPMFESADICQWLEDNAEALK